MTYVPIAFRVPERAFSRRKEDPSRGFSIHPICCNPLIVVVQMIEDFKNDLGKIRKSVTCVVCQELLFEPYCLECGHIFCYTVCRPPIRYRRR